MTNYGLVIANFRKAVTDSKNLEKISSERIKKSLDGKHKGLVGKVMRETDLSLVKRIEEMKKEKDFAGLTETEEKIIKEIKSGQLSFTGDDKKKLFHGCVNVEFDFAKEIHRQWSELDDGGFKGEKHYFKDWYQFCRLCIIEYEKVRYMEERIWHLYDMHLREHKNAYYRFHDKEFGETNFPRDFPRVSLLEEKARKFYLIHRMLLNNASFNSKKRGSDSAKPRGSINWKKTIRMQSKGNTGFVSRQNMRDFVTPENKLFITAAYWMIHRANELMKNETIMFQEREALSIVRLKMEKIIRNFPFKQVPLAVKREKHDDEYDKKVSKLVEDAKKRINAGKIQNIAYRILLKWVEEVRSNSGLHTLHGKQRNSVILLADRAIDILYEIWVFFELIHKIFITRDPVYKTDEDGLINKITITWKDMPVEIFYDKLFGVADKHQHPFTETKPDFLFRTGGKNFAVFDTKNYSSEHSKYNKRSNAKSDAFHKVMGYMMNLGCHLGLVIMPHQTWTGKLQERERFGVEKPFLFRPLLLVPDREHNEDPDKNPKIINEIVDMLDMAMPQ